LSVVKRSPPKNPTTETIKMPQVMPYQLPHILNKK
jgi:hypothetical protein